MKNYSDFQVQDWLEDSKFQNWVYRGDLDEFWETYLRNNPSQMEEIQQAKSILLSVRGELDAISEKEVQSRISQVLDKIADPGKIPANSWWKQRWLHAAAVILLLSGLGAYYRAHFTAEPELYYLMLKNQNLNEVINDSEKIKLVKLPDGSSVVLKQNARISYPSMFALDKREVYLLGEAFFEVEKNQDQPFFVYAREMVTKVTGTSFSIQANQTDDKVRLVVKTGAVEVSVLDQHASASKKPKTNKVVLRPNQLVTLTRTNLDLSTNEVEHPDLIDLPIESLDFSFKRMPLKEVFDLLQTAYGVQINFDKGITQKCTITAKLGDEPVYEKLDMICAVVNATYTIKNNIVAVHSTGCGSK